MYNQGSINEEPIKCKMEISLADKKSYDHCGDKKEDTPSHLMNDFLGAMLFPHLDQKSEKHFINFAKQPRLQFLNKKKTSAGLIKNLFCPAHSSQTIKFFGGISAIEYERERSKNSGFVIHPWSKLRQYWDLFMMATLVVNMIVLPLDISFFTYKPERGTKNNATNNISYNNPDISNTFVSFHIVSDVVCLIDILMNFRTGYRASPEKSDFQLNGNKIANHYLRTWFPVDFISTLPLHYILILSVGDLDSGDDITFNLQGATRVFKVLKVLKLLNLLKLLRLSRIIRNVSLYEEVYCWAVGFLRYIKLIGMMLLVAHWNCCLHFLVPMLQNFPDNCWVKLANLEHSPWYTQYGWALFATLSHMLSSGYGRSNPVILSEAVVTIISMVTGATFYALFIAHSMSYIAQSESSKSSYKEKYRQIKEYMAFRNLPISLQERVSNYYEQKYHHGRFFDEEMVLSQISPPLRKEIISYTCRDFVKNVSFFKVGSPEFISAVLRKLSFDVYLSGDVIYSEGTAATEMFFIRKGSVEITITGKFIENLNAGDHFGEISLLTNTRRLVTAVAITTCEMFTLDACDLRNILEEYSDMKHIIEHAAIQRIIHIVKESHLPTYDELNNDEEFLNQCEKNKLLPLNTIDVNNSGFQKKPNRLLFDALIALGGSVEKSKEMEEPCFININDNLKNAIMNHRKKYKDCILCIEKNEF